MNRRFTRALLLFFALLTVSLAHAQGESENYEKAVQAYHEEKYNEAYIHLKNALQQDPNLVSARLLLARVHFSVGDIHSAEKESAEALLLGADINLVLPVYGPSLVLQKKVDRLFEIEKSAKDFTPESRFEWALLKGQGFLLRGESDKALAEFERAADMFPEEPRSLNSLAAIYMGNGMDESALALMEKSLALDSKNAKTWELRGELAFKKGQYESARDYLLQAFELDSEDLRIQRALARFYLHLGDRENTQEYLDQILALSPADPAATLISAMLKMSEGGSELGETMLDSLSNTLSELDFVQSQSNDTMLYIQASADYLRGSDQSAITLLNAYLSRNRSDIGAISMLVDLYLRNGDTKEALELLSSNESIVSSDYGLSLQLVHLYLEQRQIYNARKLLTQVKANTRGVNPFVLILEAELLRVDGFSKDALSLLNNADFGEREPLSYGLLRGALELELRQFDEAQQSVEYLRRRYPDSVKVYHFCAATYLSLEKLADAEACIDRATELSASNIETRFSQAMLLKKRDSLEESGTILNGILDERPSHIKSILLMARILFLQGEYENAIDWSNKAYAYDRRSSSPGELQLDIYSATGDWASARVAAIQLVRANPGNAGYIERLVNIHMRLDEKDLALERMRRLSELWSEDPEKLRYLATLQVQVGAIDEARKNLQSALVINPDSYFVRLDLAGLEFVEGRYDNAAKAVLELREVYGDRVELALLSGDIALVQGQQQQAQEAFMMAFQLDHNNGIAVRRLYELSQQGVGAQAFVDALELALKESSLPVFSVRLLADSLMTQGSTASAARYYEQLLGVEGLADDPGMLNNLANIYAADDLDKGLATALRGLESEGGQSAAMLDTVGWILVRQGKNEEALSYLRKAYTKNSRDPEIRYHTGLALLGLGRDSEAAAELRAALAREQEFVGRDEAQRTLDSISQ